MAFDKVDYLLTHGSSDDNMHFANSAHLLDMLTKAQLWKFQFWMFTDRFKSRSRVKTSDEALTNQLHGDHSIQMHGANEELFEYLTNILV
jgi:dipeptidyl aminopeptidase